MKTPEQRAEEIDFSNTISFDYPEDLQKGREQIAQAIREHAEEQAEVLNGEFEQSVALLKELMEYGTGGNWPTGSADAWDAAFTRCEDFIASLK